MSVFKKTFNDLLSVPLLMLCLPSTASARPSVVFLIDSGLDLTQYSKQVASIDGIPQVFDLSRPESTDSPVPSIKDDISHGTKVMSVISALNPGVRVVPIQVISLASSSAASSKNDLVIARAIQLVARLAPRFIREGSDVLVNMSLVSSESDLSPEAKAAWRNSFEALSKVDLDHLWVVTSLGEAKSGGLLKLGYPSHFSADFPGLILTVVSENADGKVSEFSDVSSDVNSVAEGEHLPIQWSKDASQYSKVQEIMQGNDDAAKSRVSHSTGNSFAVGNEIGKITLRLEQGVELKTLKLRCNQRPSASTELDYVGLQALIRSQGDCLK